MLYVKNLEKTFNIGTENEIKIFEDLNLHIEDGKCTALLGSNGCGKSTLMNIISGSIMQDSGDIILDIKDERGKKVSLHRQGSSKSVIWGISLTYYT